MMVGAWALSATTIRIQWTPAGSADSFAVERYSGGASQWVVLPTPLPGYTFLDIDTQPALTAALYRVRAIKGGTSSVASAVDAATLILFADDPVQPNITKVTAQHINQLRTAVNAMRALAGLSPATFTNAGPPPSSLIAAVHVQELRTALDSARAALNLPSTAYAYPTPAVGDKVRAAQINDLRGGVR
jgi:hypothetical protein